MGPGTRDFVSEVGPGTRDPLSGTRDPGPRTRDPLCGTRDPGPCKWDPGPIMRDPGPSTKNIFYRPNFFFKSDPRTAVENMFMAFIV